MANGEMGQGQLTPEALDQLMKSGAISQSTYDRGMGVLGGVPATPVPPGGVGQAQAQEPVQQPIQQPIQQQEQQPQTQPQVSPQDLSQIPGGQPQISPEIPAQRQPDTGFERVKQSYELGEKGLALEAQAGRDQAAREAGYYDQAQKELDKQHAASQVKQDEWQKQMEANLAQQRKLTDDLNNYKIDSKRVWNNMNTGQKVLSGIAMFLGGFAGGKNPALQMMTDAINRDIDDQKTQFSAKKEKLGALKGIFGDMMQIYGNSRMAEAQTRLYYNQRLENQLKSSAAQYKSPLIQAQAMKGMAMLEQERGKLQMEVDKAAQTQRAYQTLGMGEGEEAKALAQIPEKERERYISAAGIEGVPQIRGMTTTKKGAEQLREQVANTRSVVENINDLKALGSRNIPGSQKRAEAGVIQNALIGQLRLALTGPGPLTDAEREFIKDIIANPGEITSIQAGAKLNRLKLMLSRNLMNTAKAQGLRVPKLEEGAPVR